MGKGTQLLDITGIYQAELKNSPQWKSSRAPIGDTAIQLYTNSWGAQTLSLASLAHGTFDVSNITGMPDGIHLYFIGDTIADSTGINALKSNNGYYGVFTVNAATSKYDYNYNYQALTKAMAAENGIDLYGRSLDAHGWTLSGATKNISVHDFAATDSVSREFVIGNFTSSCLAPTAGLTAGITFNSAQISWTSGGASTWDIEYGVTGFTLGTGTQVNSITSNPYSLNGLQHSTTYQFYVRDNCGSLGTSVWAGPFSFTTMAAPVCPDPTNLALVKLGFSFVEASWTTGGSNIWNVEYGPVGFTPGTGTRISSVTTNPLSISGLSPATAYELYIQDTCNSINASNWIGPLSFTTFADNRNRGSGMALNIAGAGMAHATGAKQSASTLNLPDSTITLEAWFKPRSFGQWKSIIAFIQDNGSFERGFDLETRNGNKFGFTLKSTGASSMTYMETSRSFDANKWYHIAGVYDGDTMKIYINGVLENFNTSQNGKIDYADSWLSIGSYKDDNEDFSVNGDIDEIRIWNSARSQEQIRQFMCQKLKGTEANLVTYYNFNAGEDTVITDWGSAGNHARFANGLSSSAWVYSGAALGDTSIYSYDVASANVSLNLASAAHGALTLDSVSGGAEGVHLYFVDTLPNFTAGINDIGNQEVYFGSFVAEGTTPSTHNLTYDYNSYPNALSNQNFLNLYNRLNASVRTWINTGATRNSTLGTVEYKNARGRRELLLADFVAASCPPPSSLGVANAQYFYADVIWNSGGATSWNVEYGVSGFGLGSGTAQVVSNAAATTLTGLQHSTTYDFYVQDSCGAADVSSWVGPFSFTTLDICPDIDSVKLNAVTGNSASFDIYSGGNGTDWDIQWGPTGFAQGLGILTQSTGQPANLLNISPNTSYDAYFRADCDSISSEWFGPITFTTDSTSGFSVVEQSLAHSIKVYPNPTNGGFTLEVDFAGLYNIIITDLNGRVLFESPVYGGGAINKEFNWNLAPKGMYLINLYTEEGAVTKKLTIQ
jgi:protein associated with RNAse G/E